jgi:hypothetical protein
MMTDYRAGSDGGNPAPERRSPKGAAAMGAVAPVLAIANIVVMVGLSLSSYPLDEVLHYVRFEPAGPALALFGVILIVALVLSFIPQTRGAGLGMLLSMGGFLAMDWTSISVTFYSKSGTGFEVYQLQGGQVAAACSSAWQPPVPSPGYSSSISIHCSFRSRASPRWVSSWTSSGSSR